MAFFLSGLLGLFVSAIGVALILYPFNTVQAFGIDPSHMADLALAPGLGMRQLAIGLIVISLAFRRQAGALGTVLLVGSLVPMGDFAIAGKAFGYGAAVRHLIPLPFSLILGLILVRR